MRVGKLSLPSVMEGSSELQIDFGYMESDPHEQVTIRHVHSAEDLLQVVRLDFRMLQAEKFVNSVKRLGATLLYDVSDPSLFHAACTEVNSLIGILQTSVEMPHL